MGHHDDTPRVDMPICPESTIHLVISLENKLFELSVRFYYEPDILKRTVL